MLPDPLGQGLLGFMLTLAELLALPWSAGQQAVAFVPMPNPGPQPVLAPGANTLHVSIHNAE